MRILVYGAGGYLGQNLARFLLASGHEVVGLVRNARPTLPGAELWVAHSADAVSKLDVVPGQLDLIVNCAAAGVHPTDRDPVKLAHANSLLPQVLVTCAARWGVRAVVQIGSSAEYAETKDGTALVEDAPLVTDRLYGASKAAGSLLALATGRQLGVPVAVLRLFNLFGAGEAPHRLLPFLVAQLRKQASVPLSRGTQCRDFVSVGEACEAILAAGQLLLQDDDKTGIYNLCTGRATSVADFALLVASALRADPALLRFGELPMRADDYGFVVGDPARLNAATGWHPARSLRVEVEIAARQELDLPR